MLLREPILIRRRPAYNAPAAPAEQVYRLPVDAYTTEDSIVLTASVPGLHPEDVEITVDDDTLTIRGELNGVHNDGRYLLRERFHGKFERRLAINIPVDVSAAQATFENGVLQVVLPKAEEAKPHRIAVRSVEQ